MWLKHGGMPGYAYGALFSLPTRQGIRREVYVCMHYFGFIIHNKNFSQKLLVNIIYPSVNLKYTKYYFANIFILNQR